MPKRKNYKNHRKKKLTKTNDASEIGLKSVNERLEFGVVTEDKEETVKK